ncbi:hypothetical protein DOM22_12115 [Bdellovibrio sp. ZAP7]|uniref:TIGR02147 family protein n=1 Tax=Bdellovibrio sp. ZAP7 TaxID=2231053 RepID=UPI00115B08DE|nr:TIGR02147 family protein [Bdellovibrio sp. ZAP7]QDK45842.1 hypothetical protein DOM22_12115 [Bdellovibrio sp. ZAP7]
MNHTYRDILSSELLTRKQSNPRFSLRAFAKQLDLSASHLSSLIIGKRNLTPQQAHKLLNKLELSPADKSLFLSSAFPHILETPTAQERQTQLIADDKFTFLADWYHFAILSLGDISLNKATPAWVSERLGISELQARDALNRLQRLDLISIKSDGSFKQTGNPLTTTDDIPSGAIKAYHRSVIDLAKTKLDTVPVEEREYGAITLAINPAKIGKAKKMIRDFQNQLCEELEVGKKKSVYTLSVQFFPVSETKE